ncbi:uncharacterized protein LOC126553400 isoform X1 [Aphis gossypii]|uniref:uncharacterized protein LOC126553400 isoform X1 n=1 Tax=Aphis gossypii TaxID=80765 RepID=UPI0021591E51|nr:uncharacterized protein LOC126553400 isoform X1 [Aphis gossypii]
MESYYDILKTSRAHLKADGKPKTSKFHKWTNVVKPLYDRMKNEEKQLNEEIDKINNSRTPRLSLAQITDHLSRSNTKPNSSMTTDPKNEKMFNFTATPKVKRGSGLYKDVIPQTQLVYYDDPNELVTRLNLLTSSQNVGNTGVNNEIISILEELRERNIIV